MGKYELLHSLKEAYGSSLMQSVLSYMDVLIEERKERLVSEKEGADELRGGILALRQFKRDVGHKAESQYRKRDGGFD